MSFIFILLLCSVVHRRCIFRFCFCNFVVFFNVSVLFRCRVAVLVVVVDAFRCCYCGGNGGGSGDGAAGLMMVLVLVEMAVVVVGCNLLLSVHFANVVLLF